MGAVGHYCLLLLEQSIFINPESVLLSAECWSNLLPPPLLRASLGSGALQVALYHRWLREGT